MVELKAKDIAVIGLLSASITIGKLALSLVPNVEIVSLLFIVYTIVFGVKHSIIISIIFSTTEIFIYGLSTWLLGYYFIWPMLIFITHIVKKTVKDEYGYATIAGLFGLFWGFCYSRILFLWICIRIDILDSRNSLRYIAWGFQFYNCVDSL